MQALSVHGGFGVHCPWHVSPRILLRYVFSVNKSARPESLYVPTNKMLRRFCYLLHALRDIAKTVQNGIPELD